MKLALVIAAAFVASCGGSTENGAENGTAETPSVSDNAPPSSPLTAELAECKHAEQASIYNRPAKVWRAEQFGGDYVNLTVWQLNAGGTEFSFARSQSNNQYRIDTVDGSQKVGSGTVTMTQAGEGVAFEVKGKDQNGNDLEATVKCAKLVPLVAEGG